MSSWTQLKTHSFLLSDKLFLLLVLSSSCFLSVISPSEVSPASPVSNCLNHAQMLDRTGQWVACVYMCHIYLSLCRLASVFVEFVSPPLITQPLSFISLSVPSGPSQSLTCFLSLVHPIIPLFLSACHGRLRRLCFRVLQPDTERHIVSLSQHEYNTHAHFLYQFN